MNNIINFSKDCTHSNIYSLGNHPKQDQLGLERGQLVLGLLSPLNLLTLLNTIKLFQPSLNNPPPSSPQILLDLHSSNFTPIILLSSGPSQLAVPSQPCGPSQFSGHPCHSQTSQLSWSAEPVFLGDKIGHLNFSSTFLDALASLEPFVTHSLIGGFSNRPIYLIYFVCQTLHLDLSNVSRHLSNVSRHLSNVSRHLSNVSRHLSNVSRHLSNVLSIFFCGLYFI